MSILTDGAIAVLMCSMGGCYFGFDVKLVHDNPKDPVKVWTRAVGNHNLAKMVSMGGYVYIMFGEALPSTMKLLVFSTADWKIKVSYNFDESVQLTFTQSNPPAKNNTVMLEIAVYSVPTKA